MSCDNICHHYTVSRAGISEQDMLNVSPEKLTFWTVGVGDERKELLFRTDLASTIDPHTYRCQRCGEQFAKDDLIRQQELFNYVSNKTIETCLKHVEIFSTSDVICRLDPASAAKIFGYELRWAYILGKIPRHDFASDEVFLRLASGLEPVRLNADGVVTGVLLDPSEWNFI